MSLHVCVPNVSDSTLVVQGDAEAYLYYVYENLLPAIVQLSNWRFTFTCVPAQRIGSVMGVQFATLVGERYFDVSTGSLAVYFDGAAGEVEPYVDRTRSSFRVR